MKIPQDVKLAISAAEHRAENGVTTPLEEMVELLKRYPILRFDTETGYDHPLSVIACLLKGHPELATEAKARRDR